MIAASPSVSSIMLPGTGQPKNHYASLISGWQSNSI